MNLQQKVLLEIVGEIDEMFMSGSLLFKFKMVEMIISCSVILTL